MEGVRHWPLILSLWRTFWLMLKHSKPTTLTFSKFILWPNSITMSNYSSKPGTLLWTRSLGTITSYYQKPTKCIAQAWITWSRTQASRYVTLNSVWLRISFSYHCWRLKHYPKHLLQNIKSQWRIFSIELMTSPDYTFSIFRVLSYLYTSKYIICL